MKPQIRGEFPRVVDSTIISDYKSCQTKGHYSFGRQLGSPYGSVHLIAGGSFARGLEVFRKNFYGNGLDFGESLKLCMLAAIEEYGAFECPDDKQEKSLERVLEAFPAYFERWPPSTDHLKPHMVNSVPQVECTFSIPLPILHPDTGEPIIYAGRYDMLGEYQRSDQLVVVDEKTTSQLGPTWKSQWNLRGQFSGYCWSAREFGKPVIGAIVRGISFLKRSFGTEEVLQLRPDWMLEVWYNQMLRDVEKMKQAYVENWYDQALGSACADFGGCPFQRLCTVPDPDNWIEGHYVTRSWNPLAKVAPTQPKQVVEVVQNPFANV